MQIVIVGSSANFEECRQKFGDDHSYLLYEHTDKSKHFLSQSDVVFDFLPDNIPFDFDSRLNPFEAIFLNTSCTSLQQLTDRGHCAQSCPVFGFAGMRTFLNREIFEVSMRRPGDLHQLKEVCQLLKTEFQIVKDYPGMVTPRVICMIINEAYFALSEGTATREDIDLAMKMGTNYPFGPFEWCLKIGARNILELLEAMRSETRDERYLVCPLLAKEATREF
jgi:3-hydroxybutyryl-CoA dehydrogenase